MINIALHSINFSSVVIIRGQSNAVGSYTGTPSQSYLQESMSWAKIWYQNQWQILDYPINQQGYQPNDFGSELSIAYRLKGIFKEIYIIKDAYGGTQIQQYISGGTYYNSFKTKANTAIQALIDQGKNPKVIFIHLNQGEANAANTTKTQYATYLRQLYSEHKSDILRCNKAKLITCALYSPHYTGYQNIADAQIEVGSEPNCGYYLENDLATYSDGIHFTNDSQVLIGNRVVDKYLQLRNL